MLRSSLTKTLSANYNNFNNWRRYHKNFPHQVEPKIFKKQFAPGDPAQFAYDNKIAWPEEYKPWNNQWPYEYVFGVALVLLYIDWRTDRIRQKQGITETHSYPI